MKTRYENKKNKQTNLVFVLRKLSVNNIRHILLVFASPSATPIYVILYLFKTNSKQIEGIEIYKQK